MHVALVTTFSANRKEPLAVLLERIHAAFLASGLGEPVILFPDSFAERDAQHEIDGEFLGSGRKLR
jgi:hypothetical protein